MDHTLVNHKVALENAQAMMRIVLLTNPLKLDLTLVGYCKNSYSYQPEMNIGTYLHGCNAHEWNFFKVEKSALNHNVCNIIGFCIKKAVSLNLLFTFLMPVQKKNREATTPILPSVQLCI